MHCWALCGPEMHVRLANVHYPPLCGVEMDVRSLAAPAERHPREASGAARRITGVTVIVLGIDPGTANTGYGVVLAHGQRLAALDGGVIATEANEPLEKRLVRIHARMCDLIREHAPHAVAIEDLFFGNNARSAFSV